ncbi:MAG TPA: hypothetical protein VFG73_01865 [Rhodanobacteraceae bacterium]|nr:hypothetical protein [Rhodanobacteraceae bacterium]
MPALAAVGTSEASAAARALYQEQVHRPLTDAERAMLARVAAQQDAHAAASANAAPRIRSVMMRGDLRMLTAADRALFMPPPGYLQVQASGSGTSP